jgi:hypothetical protein
MWPGHGIVVSALAARGARFGKYSREVLMPDFHNA